MKNIYVECACSLPDHVVRVTVDEDDKEAYAYIQLDDLGFYQRLVLGVKYILGIGYSQHGHWAEVVIDSSQAGVLVDALNKIRQ